MVNRLNKNYRPVDKVLVDSVKKFILVSKVNENL